jgi:GNAT superfamily N-acetyltransferase
VTTPRTERARAFDRELRLAIAAEVVERPYGWALRHSELDWRDLNNLHVRAEVSAETLLADLDGRRFIVVEPREVADALVPGLHAAGFHRRQSLLMSFEDERPDALDARVEELDPHLCRDLRHEWLLDEAPRASIAASGVRADDLLYDAFPVRAFCVRGEAGAPIAMTLLIGDGETQMIEDVYTTPSARGQGLASALVRRAVSEAGSADLVFLPTDPDGKARVLYERLGFAELCRTALFALDA